MASVLGKQAVPALEEAIVKSLSGDVIWHSTLTTSIDSFVGLVQFYSDNSFTSLKNSVITS